MIRLTACLVVLSLIACSSDSTTDPDPPEEPGPPADLAIVAGDAQTGTVAAELADTLVGRVVDAGGEAVPGAVVSWAGDGDVFAAATESGTDGVVRNTWTLGTLAGEQAIEARWVDPESGDARVLATFTATAEPGPVVVAYEPDTLWGFVGDTLPVGGSRDEHGNLVGYWSLPDGLALVGDSAVSPTARGMHDAEYYEAGGEHLGTTTVTAFLSQTGTWVHTITCDSAGGVQYVRTDTVEARSDPYHVPQNEWVQYDRTHAIHARLERVSGDGRTTIWTASSGPNRATFLLTDALVWNHDYRDLDDSRETKSIYAAATGTRTYEASGHYSNLEPTPFRAAFTSCRAIITEPYAGSAAPDMGLSLASWAVEVP